MSIVSDLKQFLPPEIVTGDLSRLEAYATDRSYVKRSTPLCVVTPTQSIQVKKILEYASFHSVPVVTRGLGSGMTGGAVPSAPSIILSLENMNRIIEIDDLNRIAVVEPGVITAALKRAAEKKQLYYPPDPASLDICTIGGNVAENAGGPCAVKYGVTGDYVTGMEGFFASGEPFKFGGKLFKNVAGYDVSRLLIGSEGTLAVMTKLYLKLIPLPAIKVDMLVYFDDYNSAVNTLKQLHQSHVRPVTAEFLDRACLGYVAAYLNITLPYPNAAAQLIIGLDGDDAAALENDCEKIRRICRENQAVQVTVARTRQEQEKIWHIRRNVSPALRQGGGDKISHDIVVPPYSVAEYLTKIRETGVRLGITILGYGHLGDGNIHVNILKAQLDAQDWSRKKQEAEEAVLKLAVEMGGSITGEHGIGLTKKPFLHLMFSPAERELFRQLKQLFDPKNILNPGKII